jgi:hypothetical protein
MNIQTVGEQTIGGGGGGQAQGGVGGSILT